VWPYIVWLCSPSTCSFFSTIDYCKCSDWTTYLTLPNTPLFQLFSCLTFQAHLPTHFISFHLSYSFPLVLVLVFLSFLPIILFTPAHPPNQSSIPFSFSSSSCHISNFLFVIAIVILCPFVPFASFDLCQPFVSTIFQLLIFPHLLLYFSFHQA